MGFQKGQSPFGGPYPLRGAHCTLLLLLFFSFLLLLMRYYSIGPNRLDRFNRKLLGSGRRPGPQIINTRLESFSPCIDVHTAECLEVGIRQKQVQGLTLANVGSSVRRHINQDLLLDFPHRLEDTLNILRNLRQS